MNPKFMQIITIFVICKALLVYADVEPLKSKSDELDPLNDTENADNSGKGLDKRTILNPTLKNVAWAKHIAVKPSGAKFVIGYGPVDFKYQPVLKPIAIKHQGYHYNRPKIHFHIRRPIIHIPQVKPVIQTEWKPIVKPLPFIKPAPAPLPIHIHPVVHEDQLHLNPVPHIDHIHREPVIHVGHPQHVHIDHVHHLPTAHIDHLHQVPVQIPHVHALPHIHAIPHVHASPFVPSAQLFEVTKPDLGVLPLGSVFPTTALKEVPAPHLIPQHVHHAHLVPVAPQVPELHPVTHLQPVHPIAPPPQVAHFPPVAPVQPPVAHVHPVAPIQHVVPSAPIHPVGSIHPAHVDIIPHFQTPGHVFPLSPLPQVEHIHHGDHIHPVGHLQPVHPLGQLYPVNQPLPAPLPPPNGDYHGHPPLRLPNHYHLQYPQIPQAHGPSDEPPNGGQNFYPYQQHVPLDTQHHFQDGGQNIYQQQQPVPLDAQPHFQDGGQYTYQQQPHLQPEGNVQDAYPYQEDPRYQPANHVSSQHFFREGQFQIGDQGDGQGYVYQQPQGRLIQPGQTDLQFPLQLPHHPAFDRGFDEDNRQEASQQNEKIFRPSIQLEPPYKK